MDISTNNQENNLTTVVGEVEEEVSVFLPTSGGEDDNGNEVLEGKTFVPPEPTGNPYESFKMVEELPQSEIGGRKKSPGFMCACQNYLGIFFTLGSGFIFTVAGVIVKYMKDYHPLSLAVYRFQGVLLPAFVLALYAHYVKKEQVFSTIWPLTDKEKLKKFIFCGVS